MAIIVLFGLTSSKVSPKNLYKYIDQSELIFIADISELKKDEIKFSNLKLTYSKKTHKEIYLYSKIEQYKHLFTGEEGKYLIISDKEKNKLKSKNVKCIFKIIDGSVLITRPFLSHLTEKGFVEKIDFHEEFRYKLTNNTFSDNYGYKIELNRFLELINNIKQNTDSILNKYADGSFEKALLKGN